MILNIRRIIVKRYRKYQDEMPWLSPNYPDIERAKKLYQCYEKCLEEIEKQGKSTDDERIGLQIATRMKFVKKETPKWKKILYFPFVIIELLLFFYFLYALFSLLFH